MYLLCFPPLTLYCINQFHFILELFWTSSFPLECFSRFTSDIIDISGFKLALGPSVTEIVLIDLQQQANNSSSNVNSLIQNSNGHSWETLIDLCHKLLYKLYMGMLYREFVLTSSSASVLQCVDSGSLNGCHFISVTQLCPTLCNLMECRTPGFSVHD